MNIHRIFHLFLIAVAQTVAGFAAEPTAARTVTLRVPDGGLQPQLVLQDGILHILYLKGAPEKADIIYRQSKDYGQTFSPPLQVNSKGSAIAIGNIRGPQLAVGRNGRAHITWNGADAQNRMPMLYTRINNSGTRFEPERNLITSAWGLDGGGAIASDQRGNIFVFWHAPIPGSSGEENRRVWLAKSRDDGASFEPERIAFESPVGACGCCGMKAWSDPQGTLYAMFRSAKDMVHRDTWLLTSNDEGRNFKGSNLSPWKIGACVMSSASLTQAPNGVLAAWETENQAHFGLIEKGAQKVSEQTSAPGKPSNRKHPVAVSNQQGEILFAWTEGMAWKKPGAISWQIQNAKGKIISPMTTLDGVPAWSLIAAFSKPDGTFVVVY